MFHPSMITINAYRKIEVFQKMLKCVNEDVEEEMLLRLK